MDVKTNARTSVPPLIWNTRNIAIINTEYWIGQRKKTEDRNCSMHAYSNLLDYLLYSTCDNLLSFLNLRSLFYPRSKSNHRVHNFHGALPKSGRLLILTFREKIFLKRFFLVRLLLLNRSLTRRADSVTYREPSCSGFHFSMSNSRTSLYSGLFPEKIKHAHIVQSACACTFDVISAQCTCNAFYGMFL